jgi:uncharacterized protein
LNKPIILTSWNNRHVHSYLIRQRGDDCDCDCACENLSPETSLETSLEGFWTCMPGARPIFSVDDWIAIYNPNGLIAVSVVNPIGLKLWESFARSRQITELDVESSDIAIQMAKIGLLDVLNKTEKVESKSQKKLSAWLHLTNACNLRCDYCYLSKTSEGMSKETAFASLKTLFESARKHNYQSVKMKYGGGEPLIKFELLKEMHVEAKRLSEAYDIEMEEVIITNGTLLREEHIIYLLNQKIRLSLSLDGIGVIHDQQRSYLDGRGSFTEIEKNLFLCKEMGIRPDITITVTDRNADSLAEVSKYLLDQGFQFNFNFYRENDCSMELRDLELGEEKVIRGIRNAYQLIEKNLPEWSLLGALADRSSFAFPHTHACSVGHDYMVIDHHGKIAKCQMAIGLPVTSIYEADPLVKIRNDRNGIQNLSVENKEGCKTCEWRNWCAGGCPLATYRASGRYDIKSPNCNIYKSIYPGLLRLEVLRLIKQSTV